MTHLRVVPEDQYHVMVDHSFVGRIDHLIINAARWPNMPPERAFVTKINGRPA